MRLRAPTTLLAVALLAALIAVSATSQAASTSTSVVGATVLSATTLDAAACASGQLGKTDFGPVTAGSSNVTTLDCSIAFGSSNDTAQLRMRQADVTGVAMFSPTRGELDTSFDSDGIAITATSPTSGYDAAYAIAIQPDGRTVTAGYCQMDGVTGPNTCLVRYDTAGLLDATFDGDGRVVTSLAPGNGIDFASAVAIQADGRIVTAGTCSMGGDDDACLARYNPNGSLDTTFDTDGRVTTATGPSTDAAFAIAIQADGKLVTAGRCWIGGATGWDACLARYNTDGSLDTTFDIDGRVTTATAPGTATDGAFAIAIQVDGRIVTAGRCSMGGATGDDACLARYDTAGSLDTTFDTDGRVTTATAPGTGDDAAFAIALQADGRIVTAGRCSMGGATGTDACLARYNAGGSLDTTFDTDGRVTTATAPGTGTDAAYAITTQPDGRIVIAGECVLGGATGTDTCLARYNPDGSLDTKFDTDGRVTTAAAPGSDSDYANAFAVQPDGRIVTAGECNMGITTGQDVCVVQYDNAGTLEQYADDGVRDWDTAGSAPNLFGACLRAVSGGASAQWATSATCPATDGAYWNAVPTASTRIAYTTALEPDPPDATASLRFGLRTAGNQPAGSYIAPITFDVIAPNA